MTHAAIVARHGLNFLVPRNAAHVPLPYFPQGIPAGFPSSADDHVQRTLDLHEHLIKHPAATFYAHVQGDFADFS